MNWNYFKMTWLIPICVAVIAGIIVVALTPTVISIREPIGEAIGNAPSGIEQKHTAVDANDNSPIRDATSTTEIGQSTDNDSGIPCYSENSQYGFDIADESIATIESDSPISVTDDDTNELIVSTDNCLPSAQPESVSYYDGFYYFGDGCMSPQRFVLSDCSFPEDVFEMPDDCNDVTFIVSSKDCYNRMTSISLVGSDYGFALSSDLSVPTHIKITDGFYEIECQTQTGESEYTPYKSVQVLIDHSGVYSLVF